MKKMIIFLMVFGFSNYIFLSQLEPNVPEKYRSLRLAIKEKCLKHKYPFCEKLFNAIICKIDTRFKSVDIDWFKKSEETDLKRAQIRQAVSIGELIVSIYIPLSQVLNAVKKCSDPEQKMFDLDSDLNKECLEQFFVFTNFLNKHGNFSQICDHMCQAVQDISIEDVSRAVPVNKVFFGKENDVRIEFYDFHDLILLKFKTNVIHANNKAEEVNRLKIAQAKCALLNLESEEQSQRALIEQPALNAALISFNIEQKIAQQNFKAKLKEERTILSEEQVALRCQINLENIEERLKFVEAAGESYKSITAIEEDQDRSMFFKRFIRKAALMVVQCRNAQHAKMVEHKRQNRLIFLKSQQQLIDESDKAFNDLQQENDIARASIDKQSMGSFIKAFASFIPFQRWQKDVLRIVEESSRNRIEIEEDLGQQLILKYKPVAPVVISTRRNDPYGAVVFPVTVRRNDPYSSDNPSIVIHR